MDIKRTGTVLLTLLLAAGPAFAGTDAAAFLNSGVGARALAMGGAFVSVCDDPTAMYWNPAGLARINRFSVTTMSQSLGPTQWDTLSDITPSYQFMGVTCPISRAGLNKGTIAAGMISNGLDNVTYSYLDTSGQIVRDTFADTENAYFISGAVPLLSSRDNLYAGATLTYINQAFSKIAGANAAGYDASFGLLYCIGDAGIGLVIDRGADLTWANGRDDSAGLMTKLGVSDRFGLSRYLSILGSLDIVQRKDEPMEVNVGTEFGWEKKLGSENGILFEGIFLRGGLEGYAVEDRDNSASAINSNINYTMGMGLDISFWGYYLQLDYAMGSYSLGNKDNISVSMYF